MAIDQKAAEIAQISCRLTKACLTKEEVFSSRFNLTAGEFKMLKLFSNDDVLPVKYLIEELNLTPGRITHLLTSLERKKLVTRKRHKEDKRVALVGLTAKSRQFVSMLLEEHVALHQEIMNQMSPKQIDSVMTALELFLKAMNNWTDRLKATTNPKKHR